MTLTCEQTLNNLPRLLVEADTQPGDPPRRQLLNHLRSCPACQREYEALWHTVDVLKRAEAPAPPPELVGNIQRRVRELHRQQQVAFFASPVAWCLDRLKVDFSPRFVNAVALLFFLAASGFVARLAFFTDTPEPELGLTAMERTRLQHVRISPSPWAGIKDSETAEPRTPRALDTPSLVTPQTREPFFGTARDTARIWSTDTGGDAPQPLEISTESLAGEKLTVFWNHIKTGS